MLRINRKCIHRDKRRGGIIVLAAICLVVVVAFMAFSIDYGYIIVAESDLQNAADAGALSGARALKDGRAPAVTAAKTWAGKNVAAGESVVVAEENVEIGVWNNDTASFNALPPHSSETPNAVRVTCGRTAAGGNPLGLFFAPMIGTDTTDLSVTATAAIQRRACGLFVGIEEAEIQSGQTDSYDSSFGSYQSQSSRQNGDVCSDGPIGLGPTGRINGDARPGERFTVENPQNVTGSIEPRTRQIDWEPVDITSYHDNDNDLIPDWAWQGGQIRLSNDDILVLSGGRYYFPNGMSISGRGELRVTGPTEILLGGASSVSGSGIVNETNLPANLKIEVVGSELDIVGSSDLHADIYGPTASVAVRGQGDFFGAIFANRLQFSGGNSTAHGDEALLRDPKSSNVKVTLKQ